MYVGLADDGVCPFCAHRMTSTVEPRSELRPDAPPVRFDCAGCGATVYAPLGLALSTRPRIDGLRSRPRPRYHALLGVRVGVFSAPTVGQREPPRVSLAITVADAEWRVVVNGDASIVDCQPSM